MTEESKEQGAAFSLFQVDTSLQTTINETYPAYKLFFFDESDPEEEDHYEEVKDDDEDDRFGTYVMPHPVCRDTSVKFEDFTENILTKILTYMDSTFFYNLYRINTVTQETLCWDGKIRPSYIWLNKLMPAAYAATLENITAWSCPNAKVRAERTQLEASQAM